jgi:hypothetical protein
MIRSAISAIPGIFLSVLNSAANFAMQAVTRLVAGAVGILRRLAGQARGALNGVRNAVVGAFAGAAGWLVSAGRNIINGLLSGIRAGFGQVRGLLNELTGMLPDWKGPEQVDKKILEKSGQLVMQGFETGLVSQFSSIRRTLGDLTGAMGGSGAYGVSAASGGNSSMTIMPGAIVIHGTGSASAQQTATEVLERLAQASLIRGR